MSTLQHSTLARQQRHNLRLVAFCLVYTVFAGALRKWVILGGPVSNVLLLGHILLPWIFYFLAAGSRRKYAPPLLVFGGVLVLMAFNPLNQTIFHGAFGILLHLGFWLIGFHYLENRHLYKWEGLAGLLMLIFFIEIGLGIVQYSLPRTHFINRYAAEGATNIAYVGEAARVTGTFSFVAGFTSWLFFVSLWIWSKAVRGASLGHITFLAGLAVLANLISGARAALAFMIVFAILMYGAALKRISFAKVLVVLLMGIFAGGLAYRQSSFVEEAWSNFYSRIEDGIRDKEFGRRTYGVVGEVIDYRGEYPWLGSGLGGTYQGARLLWGESVILKRYGGYEEEPERIILEGGFLLFFLRMLLLIYFLKELHLPLLYKVMFGLIIAFFTHSIFNVYNIVFVPLGLILLDWAYSSTGRS